MLKIAQVIDRESRMNQMWNDEENSDDADETFGADEDQVQEKRQRREDKNKKEKEKSNAAKRPNK